MGTKKFPRIEPSKAYEVGLGRPTLIDDCHALPVSWVAGYRLVDRESVGREMTPGHDRVAADHPASSDRRAQQPVRPVGFGHYQEPRGLFVEAVDHAGPLRLYLGRKTAPSPQEGVNEGAAPVPGRGVHHHPRWLIDHHERLVLVDHAHGNVFAGDRPLLGLRDLDPHDLSRLGAVARLFAPPIDQHVPLGDQGSRLGPRELGTVGNKEIEADIAVRLDGKLFDVAQTLALRRRIRHWRGCNGGAGRSLLSPKDPGEEECADADGHVSDVEGGPPQVAHPDIDEINNPGR